MHTSSQANRTRQEPPWAGVIPDDQWCVYREAIHAVRKTGARFLLGGAFGLATYTGRWRNTKDLDFFILRSDKDKVVDALTKHEFEDYYPKLAYDRSWIYRAVSNDVIVDTIWQTPNHRTVVDEDWFTRSRRITLRGEPLEAIPAEELLVIKLYVLQRDRCDWPDLLNLLYAAVGEIDWPHVIRRMKDDVPLLTGLLQVFSWLSPAKAMLIPPDIREQLSLKPASSAALARPEEEAVRILDSRSWFAAYQPPDQPMVLK